MERIEGDGFDKFPRPRSSLIADFCNKIGHKRTFKGSGSRQKTKPRNIARGFASETMRYGPEGKTPSVALFSPVQSVQVGQ